MPRAFFPTPPCPYLTLTGRETHQLLYASDYSHCHTITYHFTLPLPPFFEIPTSPISPEKFSNALTPASSSATIQRVNIYLADIKNLTRLLHYVNCLIRAPSHIISRHPNIIKRVLSNYDFNSIVSVRTRTGVYVCVCFITSSVSKPVFSLINLYLI